MEKSGFAKRIGVTDRDGFDESDYCTDCSERCEFSMVLTDSQTMKDDEYTLPGAEPPVSPEFDGS